MESSKCERQTVELETHARDRSMRNVACASSKYYNPGHTPKTQTNRKRHLQYSLEVT